MGTAWKDRIVIDPEIMGGKPVIKGTRVPLQVIIGSLAGGDPIEVHEKVNYDNMLKAQQPA